MWGLHQIVTDRLNPGNLQYGKQLARMGLRPVGERMGQSLLGVACRSLPWYAVGERVYAGQYRKEK